MEQRESLENVMVGWIVRVIKAEEGAGDMDDWRVKGKKGRKVLLEPALWDLPSYRWLKDKSREEILLKAGTRVFVRTNKETTLHDEA